MDLIKFENLKQTWMIKTFKYQKMCSAICAGSFRIQHQQQQFFFPWKLFLFNFSFLYSRFIINVPEEERTDLIRIFFQIEIAHWFYLDFYCEATQATSAALADETDNLIIQQQPIQQQLKPCSIKKFAEQNILFILKLFLYFFFLSRFYFSP